MTLLEISLINQIELHPHLLDEELIAFCNQNNIKIEAWSPFMRGQIFNDPLLQQLASKYHKTVAQLILRWNLQRGFLAVPKTITPHRLKENLKLYDFEINTEDIRALNALNDGTRIGADPLEVYLHPEIITS